MSFNWSVSDLPFLEKMVDLPLGRPLEETGDLDLFESAVSSGFSTL